MSLTDVNASRLGDTVRQALVTQKAMKQLSSREKAAPIEREEKRSGKRSGAGRPKVKPDEGADDE
jgi:hypothetical protein